MTRVALTLLLAALAVAPIAIGDDLLPTLPGQQQAPQGAPPPAGANPQPATEQVRTACMSDVQKLCQGVQPGGGRIIACLKEHKDQVSDACKQAIMGAIKAQKPA